MKKNISILKFSRKASVHEEKLKINSTLKPSRKLSTEEIISQKPSEFNKDNENIISAITAEIVDSIPENAKKLEPAQLTQPVFTHKKTVSKTPATAKKSKPRGVLTTLDELLHTFNTTPFNSDIILSLKTYNRTMLNIAVKLYIKKHDLSDHFEKVFDLLPNNSYFRKHSTAKYKYTPCSDEKKKKVSLKKEFVALKKRSPIKKRTSQPENSDANTASEPIKKENNDHISKIDHNITVKEIEINEKINSILHCMDAVEKVKKTFALLQCPDEKLQFIVEKLSKFSDTFLNTMIFKRLAACKEMWSTKFLIEKLHFESDPVLCSLILNALHENNLTDDDVHIIVKTVQKYKHEDLCYALAKLTIRFPHKALQKMCEKLSRNYTHKITVYALLKKASAHIVEDDLSKFKRILLFNPYITIKKISCGILNLPHHMKKMLTHN